MSFGVKMPRKLNWFGWSIETIAAVYETDQAVREYQQGLVNSDYWVAAAYAEFKQAELDKESKNDT
jgi:hypothetical protein